MYKKLTKFGLAATVAITMSACSSNDSGCSTEEDVKAKAKEMITKIQKLAESGDLSKIQALTGKMQKLQQAGENQDPKAACEAMDELIKEM